MTATKLGMAQVRVGHGILWNGKDDQKKWIRAKTRPHTLTQQPGSSPMEIIEESS